MNGIMDRLFPASPMMGLLGEDQQQMALQQARQQGLLGLAAGLLQAGGPSRTRTNIGQAVGSGLLAGQQMYQKALDQQLQGQLTMEKVGEARRLREQQAMARQLMPQLVTQGAPTVEGMQFPVTRDDEGNVLPGVAPGAMQINQVASNALRSLLPPADFAKVMDAIKTQFEIGKAPEPKTITLGEGQQAFAIGPGGVATQIAAGAPKVEKPTQFTGDAATVALANFGTANPNDLSAEQRAQIPQLIQQQRLAVAAAGRPSVDVKVGEGAASALIKSQIERVNVSQNAADAAAQTLRTAAGLKPLIAEGVFSGPLSGQATVVARLASSLGVTGNTTQEMLNRTSEAMQGLARLELQAAEAMRGQGAITENERSLIARAAGGNLAQFTSGEVKTLLNALEKTSKFTIGSHKRQVDALRRILPEDARSYADAFTTEYEIPTPSQVQSGRSKW